MFPHINGNLRIFFEFFVMENFPSTNFILGNNDFIIYDIHLHNNKDIYFTIGNDKHQEFSFLPFKRQIRANNVSPFNLELENFKSEQFNEAEIGLHLTYKQEIQLSTLSYTHKEALASDKDLQGPIVGHEVDIILNIERP
ncbi:hypothetical protein O181_019756 [Austropuccinia psidii MF-1]|uniref:Uncharacterized protein n=1 Tax=Austropuccinia psidii MF-1 TaxID=1389203 RepID=A0A9Q3GU63_9BASI|nr:hypothetical protein [Austropuccinia psidii MF-1]